MSAELVVLLATVALTFATVGFISVRNWPTGETPRRRLGNTTELAPFERL